MVIAAICASFLFAAAMPDAAIRRLKRRSEWLIRMRVKRSAPADVPHQRAVISGFAVANK